MDFRYEAKRGRKINLIGALCLPQCIILFGQLSSLGSCFLSIQEWLTADENEPRYPIMLCIDTNRNKEEGANLLYYCVKKYSEWLHYLLGLCKYAPFGPSEMISRNQTNNSRETTAKPNNLGSFGISRGSPVCLFSIRYLAPLFRAETIVNQQKINISALIDRSWLHKSIHIYMICTCLQPRSWVNIKKKNKQKGNNCSTWLYAFDI